MSDGIRAVFFDAVGTVLIPEPNAAAVYADAAARYGLDADPDRIAARFRQAFQKEEQADRAANWATSEERERERWRTIVNETLPGAPAKCFDELYRHFADPQSWRVPPDAAGTFAALAGRGLVLGLGSNYDDRLFTVLDGQPELAPLRERVVVSSRVGVRKPDARFFAAVVDAACCRAEEVLFVGDDRVNDYEGATTAGLRAVLLEPRARDRHVAARIKSLGELVASWLKQSDSLEFDAGICGGQPLG